MTRHIVERAKTFDSDTIPGDFGVLTAPCPRCGGQIRETYKKFQCQSCAFGFWKIMGGRQIDVGEADSLLRERQLGPLDGFRSRLGKPFSASLRLNDANEVAFDFGDGSGDDSTEAPDFTGQESLGPCPKCKARVFETTQAYVCEKAVGPEKSCDFRSGRVILQRPVEREQMQKLLATGKTDLLQFVSARTKRGFSAFLVRQPDGKIGFEFEARDATKPGARRGRSGPVAARVLGPHPRDKKPVELHAGRFGPYVKHGGVNATLPDRDKVDALTLAEAVTLLDAKAGKQGPGIPRKTKRRTPAKTAADIATILRETRTDVVVSYLPVGSEDATRWYVEQVLEAGCGFVNCIPVFIASSDYWGRKFKKAGLPIIGDDIKSQVGATIIHRTLARLFHDRGVKMLRTSQLNIGGNMDFYNMLERERLESKKVSKTQAVTSIIGHELPADDVYIGPSDYVPWLIDRKWAHIRLEGQAFGDVPLNVEMKLEVWDSPNSAGIVIDAVRLCKLALDNGISGQRVTQINRHTIHLRRHRQRDSARWRHSGAGGL
jgi:myo-inositol-1-phosphate synthase